MKNFVRMREVDSNPPAPGVCWNPFVWKKLPFFFTSQYIEKIYTKVERQEACPPVGREAIRIVALVAIGTREHQGRGCLTQDKGRRLVGSDRGIPLMPLGASR